VVGNSLDAGLLGAVGAAEKILFGFNAVSDDFAAATSANRRQLVNSAFKTIENVPVARRYDFKSQIIIVAANFALCHLFSPRNYIFKHRIQKRRRYEKIFFVLPPIPLRLKKGEFSS
jgi:hypothetical protein